MISFVVPSMPVPQPRQRHRNISMGDKSFIQNYTPAVHPVNAFKASVKLAAKQAYQAAPLVGPLSLIVAFVLPRPQKFCRKKDDPGRLWCGVKPDLDNLVKALKDALKQITWHDDCQVARTIQTKFYAARDEQPCCEVEIEVI